MLLERFFRFLPLLLAAHVHAQAVQDSLAGNTVLIIRHAEKPAAGAGLDRQGEIRAQMYVKYFEPFHEADMTFKVDALYAGADSENSSRPRLTLEPLSRTAGLPLDVSIGTKEPDRLASALRLQSHGQHPLIAWRHGQIPQLLLALGADPGKLLPNGKWPDEVFDWVLILRFDKAGKLVSQQRIGEHLDLPQQ